VSEYQYYEFLALDRPLTTAEHAEVGQLSIRAKITATSFTNGYHWSRFQGQPGRADAALPRRAPVLREPVTPLRSELANALQPSS
jgi:hypothetical protein